MTLDADTIFYGALAVGALGLTLLVCALVALRRMRAPTASVATLTDLVNLARSLGVSVIATTPARMSDEDARRFADAWRVAYLRDPRPTVLPGPHSGRIGHCPACDEPTIWGVHYCRKTAAYGPQERRPCAMCGDPVPVGTVHHCSGPRIVRPRGSGEASHE